MFIPSNIRITQNEIKLSTMNVVGFVKSLLQFYTMWTQLLWVRKGALTHCLCRNCCEHANSCCKKGGEGFEGGGGSTIAGCEQNFTTHCELMGSSGYNKTRSLRLNFHAAEHP